MNRALLSLAARAASLATALTALSCTQRSDAGAVSSASQAVTTPQSSAPGDSGSAVTRSPKHHPQPGGIVGLFFRAAAVEALDLTSAQHATIANLERQIHDDDASLRAPREALRSDLSAGIRAGAIDKAKIAADEDAVEKAALADKDARLAALDGLHATLDSAQRKEIAGDVRESIMQRTTHHGPQEMGDGGADWSARRLDRLTKQLDLDASQQKQVATLLSSQRSQSPQGSSGDHFPPPGDMRDAERRHLDNLLTAFEQDSFDAGASLTPDIDAGHARHPVRVWFEHELAFFEQLVPILTPPQRDKLAVVVEKAHAPDWHDPVEPAGDPAPEDGDWDRSNGAR